jgi:single-stranded DNA-binding protein
VVIWGVKGENAVLQLTNGDLIAVAGRLESCRCETSDGNLHEVVQIVADRLAFKHNGQFEEINDHLSW